MPLERLPVFTESPPEVLSLSEYRRMGCAAYIERCAVPLFLIYLPIYLNMLNLSLSFTQNLKFMLKNNPVEEAKAFKSELA